MDKTLKRDSAPFHVAAAKNFAARAEATGLKRMDLLEAYAKRHGSKDWNSFSAKGAIGLSLRGAGGNPVPLEERLNTAPANLFHLATLSLIEAARREGMSCRRTGPIVLTDERGISSYHDLARVGGLVLSRRPGPGCVSIFRNLDAWTIVTAADEAIRGYKGLIVVDAIGAAEAAFRASLRDIAPEATIITPVRNITSVQPRLKPLTFNAAYEFAGLAYGEGEAEIEPPAPMKLEDGMWTSRYFQMIEAFVDSRTELDPANLPEIDDLDHADPALDRFLRTVPGYERGAHRQSLKAKEQFSLLLMPLRR